MIRGRGYSEGVMALQKKKTPVTMDSLASMVQRGFLDTAERDAEFRKEVGIFRVEVENRFEHLERVILDEYHQRIERLEDQVRDLQRDFRELLGMKRK